MTKGPQQMFAECIGVGALSDVELASARTEVEAAETELRHALARGASWTERTRLEQSLQNKQRVVADAELDRQLQRQREQGWARQRAAQEAHAAVQARNSAPDEALPVLDSWGPTAEGRWVVEHARGLKVLPVGERPGPTVRPAQEADRPASPGEVPEYLEPVPYWKGS